MSEQIATVTVADIAVSQDILDYANSHQSDFVSIAGSVVVDRDLALNDINEMEQSSGIKLSTVEEEFRNLLYVSNNKFIAFTLKS